LTPRESADRVATYNGVALKRRERTIMKMHTKDFEALRTAVQAVIVAHPDAYADYKACGLSDTRYNWDLLNASGFDTCILYAYLEDSHVDTALRKITGKNG
jgi:hypothetical protein